MAVRIGGTGNSTLYGTSSRDVIFGDPYTAENPFGISAANATLDAGTAGSDTLKARGDDDQLLGDAWVVTGTGRGGNDLLHGEGGNDDMRGDAERMFGSARGGADRLYGSYDNDHAVGDANEIFENSRGGNDFPYGMAQKRSNNKEIKRSVMVRYREFWFAAALVLLATPAALAQPSNDDFDSAQIISGLPFLDASTNTNEASVADDDPSGCVGPAATVWYAFTPAADQRVEVNTFGSDYDTTLVVWTGSRGSLGEIACNDDTNDLSSRVRFDAVAGQTYYVMAGTCCGADPGSVGPGGNLTLRVVVAPPPVRLTITVDRLGGIERLTGGAVIRGTVTCSRPVPVNIDGNAVQRFNRAKIQGFFFTAVDCAGSARWEAAAVDDKFRFGGGQADAFASGNVSDEDASDQTTRRVTLRPGR